jgi:hypothetical protein
MRTPAPHRRRSTPAALISPAAVAVFLGGAVWAAAAVRRRVAELAFLFVAVVFVLFVRTVRATRAE